MLSLYLVQGRYYFKYRKQYQKLLLLKLFQAKQTFSKTSNCSDAGKQGFQKQKAREQCSRAFQNWLREKDLNLRPLGYEPNELPDCSIARQDWNYSSFILYWQADLLVHGQPVQSMPLAHCPHRESPFSGYGCNRPDVWRSEGPNP